MTKYLILAITTLLGSFAVHAQQPDLLGLGPEEQLGAGRLPSIALDSTGQPHVVADGGTNLYVYDRISGQWRSTVKDMSALVGAPQFYNPHIEIDPNDRAWISGVTWVPAGGIGVLVRENITSNPTDSQNIPLVRAGAKYPVGLLSTDPAFPDQAIVMGSNGGWRRVTYNSQTKRITQRNSGNLPFGAGGEKTAFSISKAGSVPHADGTTRGVWHSAMGGYYNDYSAYINSLMHARGERRIVWANYPDYPSQKDDGAYVRVIGDAVDPEVAYITGDFSAGGRRAGGIVMNIYNGSGMNFPPNDILTLDPNGSTGLRRFAPQTAPALDGGVFVAWTRDSQVRMRFVPPDATSLADCGPEWTVASGGPAALAVDEDGNIHLTYNRGGTMFYRVLEMTGGTPDAPTFAQDFDGDGLDDIAIFDNGTWHIRGTDDGGFKGYRGSYMGYVVGVQGDIPCPADFDGDNIADPVAYTPDVPGGKWTIRLSSTGLTEVRTGIGGSEGDVPVPADYDGDGLADLAVWDQNGTWHIARSLAGYVGLTLGDPANRDVPVPGDYDGDGAMDLAVFQPNGVWHISGTSSGYVGILSGQEGDIPAPENYHGDNRWDTVVYRPSTGKWIDQGTELFGFGSDGALPVPGRFFETDRARGGVYYPSSDSWVLFMNAPPRFGGGPTDFPIPGNWDGDAENTADIAIFRNSDATWHVLPTGANPPSSVQFGLPGDWGIPADYDGDGVMDRALYRGGNWFIDGSTAGNINYAFGAPGNIPVPGDYDGDGLDDVSIYEPSGVWHYVGTTSGYSGSLFGGAAGDTPKPHDVDGDGKEDLVIYDANSVWHSSIIDGSYSGVQWGNPGMVPVSGDMLDHAGDPQTRALYDPTSRTFYVYPGLKQHTLPIGGPDMTPVVADYDGDGEDDFAAFRSSTGEWIIHQSDTDTYRLVGDALTIQWGTSSSVPIGVRDN